MNAEVRSNKPVNSLFFHLLQGNVIISMAIDCKKYKYSQTSPVREPNEQIKKDFSNQ